MPGAMLALIGCGAMIGFVNHRLSDRARIALIGFSNSEQKSKVANQTNLRPILHVPISFT
jgi:hypothetical protein